MRYTSGLILLLVLGTAQATPVAWTINNAVFDDGGTITGGFTYDESTNLFTNVSMTTSLTTNLNGSSYTSLAMINSNNRIASGPVDGVLLFNATFHLAFAELLTDAGGIVALINTKTSLPTREGCNAGSPFGGASCNQFGQDLRDRFLVSGTVGTASAAAEPTTLVLLGLGLAGIGFSKRK